MQPKKEMMDNLQKMIYANMMKNINKVPVQWFYYDGSKEIPYDGKTNAFLNIAFNSGYTKLTIGENVIIDFKNEIQINPDKTTFPILKIEGFVEKINNKPKSKSNEIVDKLLKEITAKVELKDNLPVLPPAPPKSDECQKVNIDKSSDEYIYIKQRMDEAFKGLYFGLKIHKLLNPRIKYFVDENLIRTAKQNKKSAQETTMNLFYLTGDTRPSEIFEQYNEVFDPRFAPPCPWGKGILFSSRPALKGYNPHRGILKSYSIILANVIVGNYCDFGTHTDNSLIYPPVISKGKPIRYDSVKGNIKGTDVYVVYSKNMAYPEYLVSYKMKFDN